RNETAGLVGDRGEHGDRPITGRESGRLLRAPFDKLRASERGGRQHARDRGGDADAEHKKILTKTTGWRLRSYAWRGAPERVALHRAQSDRRATLSGSLYFRVANGPTSGLPCVFASGPSSAATPFAIAAVSLPAWKQVKSGRSRQASGPHRRLP